MAVLGSDAHPGAKCTALAIGAHFNFKTTRCNPSAQRIARITNQRLRAVERHLPILKAKNLIGWESSKGISSNRYWLVIPDGYRTVMGDGTPTVTGDGTPTVTGDGTPTVAGDGTPAVIGGDSTVMRDGAPPSSAVVQDRHGRRSNLVNHESNLPPDLVDLWREIGAERWHEHLWDGAMIEPPKTILFKSRQHLAFALRHYQVDFDRLGYAATTRSAA